MHAGQVFDKYSNIPGSKKIKFTCLIDPRDSSKSIVGESKLYINVFAGFHFYSFTNAPDGMEIASLIFKNTYYSVMLSTESAFYLERT